MAHDARPNRDRRHGRREGGLNHAGERREGKRSAGSRDEEQVQARADANGRAMGREAAQIIKAELGTLPQQEDAR